MSSIFRVALTLRDFDEPNSSLDRLREMLDALCGTPRRLNGGGGYLRGYPEGARTINFQGGAHRIGSSGKGAGIPEGYVVVLCMQKNDPESGKCIDVTEDDRDYANRFLGSYANVATFAVGPIEFDDLSDARKDAIEAALVRAARNADPLHWGVWITQENWAAVDGGPDWIGTQAQAERIAKMWARDPNLPPGIRYEARPYIGTDPADQTPIAEAGFIIRELGPAGLLQALKNVGCDFNCDACAEVFYTGSSMHEHTCARKTQP